MKSTDISGFDICTGANLIYPILGICAKGWKMAASEINIEAIKWANDNLIVIDNEKVMENFRNNPIRQ